MYLATHPRLTSSELPAATGLIRDELDRLIGSGAFPPPRDCAGWNEKKVRAWAWGLRNSAKLAKRVELALGYRQDWWAKPEAAALKSPACTEMASCSSPDRINSPPDVRRFYCAESVPAMYALIADMPAALGLTKEQFAIVVRDDWTFPQIVCTPTGWASRAGEFDRWRAAWTHEGLVEFIDMFGPN